MNRRKLLILSYLFPPAGGISVQRALSMARYLPDSGFEVHVLRAGNAESPVRDVGLLRLIPAGVRLHNATTLEIPFALRHRVWSLIRKPGRTSGAPAPQQAAPLKDNGNNLLTRLAQRVLCPEPEVLWVPFAVRKAAQIIEQHGIDTLLVTAPPFSAFLAGNALKRRFPRLRYVADFRDEWLTFYLNNNDFQNNEFARRRAPIIERETIESADLVVAVTESSLREIRGRYSSEPAAKFQCISNGFDPAAFEGFRSRQHSGDRVLVTHVGTIYRNSSPRYYFDALNRLPEGVRAKFHTRFIGRLTDPEREILQQENTSVEIAGFMPQREALRFMEDTDYLLMTMTDPISMPGKLYEYLATGKPIVAIAPPGSEVDRMIRQNQLGWCAPPDNPGEVARMLETAYGVWNGTEIFRGRNREVAREYERPAVLAKYGRLIHGESREPAPAVVLEGSAI
jgi:glycosyltransferase involved in cell wall biosynthesis